jgi:hypothetical protein
VGWCGCRPGNKAWKDKLHNDKAAKEAIISETTTERPMKAATTSSTCTQHENNSILGTCHMSHKVAAGAQKAAPPGKNSHSYQDMFCELSELYSGRKPAVTAQNFDKAHF